jgi:hypothetical protein
MASDAVPIPDSNTEAAAPPRQVAVIAIHGVGRHEPGASAEAIATLLASQDRADNSQAYRTLPKGPRHVSGFDIETIEVPLAAVATEHVPPQPRKTLWKKIITVFDERRGFLADQRRLSAEPIGAGEAPAGESPQPSQSLQTSPSQLFDYQYMLSQLAGYEAKPDRTFWTMRYVPRRFRATPGDHFSTPPTHIYDAHYSDLSKNESSIVGFFYAFYQLLFHLAGLGLRAVYWAEAENSKPGFVGWPWRLLSSLHATAVRILIIFVPLLNLTMLAIGLAALADKLTLSPDQAPAPNDLVLGIIGASMAGLVGILGALFVLKKLRSPKSPFVWSLLPLVGVAVVISFFWFLASIAHVCVPDVSVAKWLALLTWLALAGAAIIWIARKLATMQPGADWVGGFVYVVNAAAFIFHFLGRDPNPASQAATASVLGIQLIFGELVVLWFICLLAELFSYPLSRLCLRLATDKPKRARARAAHRTGRFAFAISASFFLIVTLAIWSGICSYAGSKLKVFDRVSASFIAQNTFATGNWQYAIPDVCQLVERVKILGPEHVGAPLPVKGPCNPEEVLREPGTQKQCSVCKLNESRPPKPLDQYLDGLLLVSVTPGLPVILALIAVCFFLLVWAVAPSVLLEISPQHTPPSDDTETAHAGEWLSRGLDNTVVLIRVLWSAIVPVPLFFGVLNFLAWNHHYALHPYLLGMLNWLSRLTLPLIRGTGAGVAVSAAALVAIILKYGGAVLDTLLDVDNYLRTVPVHATPRACIAERITSLLRYVAAYRDPQGHPYERLVIVAHSLGTLVSADLLRFIAISRANDHDPVLHRDGLHAGEDKPAIPIYLMTMGSPLRALLSRFFPHLYIWVTPMPDNSSRANRLGPALDTQPEQIPAEALPKPQDLFVKGWCNVYRSGDYVGRYLWNLGWLKRNHPENDHEGAPISLIQDDASPRTRAEMCIGLGAHTHYWDRNAPDVAHVLSKIIRDPSQIFH